MDIVIAGLVGIAAGVVGGFVSGIFHITARRLRNARYIRRGEPPVKDVVFQPLFPVFAIAGLIGGLIWSGLDGWSTGAAILGGLVLPAIATTGWIVWCVLSVVRR